MGLPIPDPNKSFAEQEVTVLLAMLLFGEARGQHDDCKAGVASVVRNRVLSGKFGGDRWANVILKPMQFSSFNPSDPNRVKLLTPLAYGTEAVWNACYQIANAILNGTIADTTSRATHYFDNSMDSHPPAWALHFVHTCDIGAMRFYRDPTAYHLEKPEPVEVTNAT